MIRLNKFLALTLAFLMLSSSTLLSVVPVVFGQEEFKPLVPEFTVTLIDNSYDVPSSTTTVTDPFTGKETTTTRPGRHVVDRTIEVTIKNQPFTSYTNASGHKIDLYYIIEMKGHYSENWGRFTSNMFAAPFCKQYGSDDVVKQVSANDYEDGSQLEFRVKAVVAYDASILDDYWLRFGSQYLLDIQASSDYSDIKTLRIGSASPSQTTTFPPTTSDSNGQPQSPEQTQTPVVVFTNPLILLMVGVLFAGVVIAVVMVLLRRHLKTSTYTNTLLYQTSRAESLYA